MSSVFQLSRHSDITRAVKTLGPLNDDARLTVVDKYWQRLVTSVRFLFLFQRITTSVIFVNEN